MVNVALPTPVRADGSWDVPQTRYLRREWNRRSAWLRKHQSVPVLRLAPPHRPLFFCESCCSANFYVPICLWCKWTSAAAVKNFEEKTPRGRTMSTPRLCSAGRSAGLKRMPKKDRLRGGIVLQKIEPRGSLDTDRSTEPPDTPRSEYRDEIPPAVADMDRWAKPSTDEATLPQPFSDPYHRGQMGNRKRRLSAVDANRDFLISSKRSAHVAWSDDGLGSESQSCFSDDESQGFCRSTDSHYSGTKSEGHFPWPSRNPTRMRKAVVQSSSPAPSFTSSFTPSFSRRPLYHLIRGGASASRSTFDCGVVPEITPKRHIAPQRGGNPLAWHTTEGFHALVDESDFPTSVPPIMSLSSGGFSLSGETEQRMNLARVVHDGRFVFHEGKPKKRDRIMRGLRRSFKSFFGSKV